MSPRPKPKPKHSVRALTGVEKCPKCGVLQDWKDQFMTVGVGEDTVRWWRCHSCGHNFRSWGDQILDRGHWPVRQEDGSYKVELVMGRRF